VVDVDGFLTCVQCLLLYICPPGSRVHIEVYHAVSVDRIQSRVSNLRELASELMLHRAVKTSSTVETFMCMVESILRDD
jgi:hypothetical protein